MSLLTITLPYTKKNSDFVLCYKKLLHFVNAFLMSFYCYMKTHRYRSSYENFMPKAYHVSKKMQDFQKAAYFISSHVVEQNLSK